MFICRVSVESFFFLFLGVVVLFWSECSCVRAAFVWCCGNGDADVTFWKYGPSRLRHFIVKTVGEVIYKNTGRWLLVEERNYFGGGFRSRSRILVGGTGKPSRQSALECTTTFLIRLCINFAHLPGVRNPIGCRGIPCFCRIVFPLRLLVSRPGFFPLLCTIRSFQFV